MRRKSISAKSSKSASPAMQMGASGTLRSNSFEETPVLPEMPPFFPDPVALDEDDTHLRVLRDELFQREYECSIKVLQEHLEQPKQEQQPKPKQERRGRSRSRDLLQDRGSDDAQVERTSCDKTTPSTEFLVASGFTSAAPIVPNLNDGCGASYPSFSAASPIKKGKMKKQKKSGEGEGEDTAEQLPLVPELSLSALPDNNVVDGESARQIASSKGRPATADVDEGYWRRQLGLPELPVYLSEPMPPELVALAEEIGFANATRETRAIATSVNSHLKEGLPDGTTWAPPSIMYALAAPKTTSGATTTNNTIAAEAVVATATPPTMTPRGTLMTTASTGRQSAVFPLTDAFVLEAEQRLAAEMFCEMICKSIVESAAEMYVSRCFDAVATAYTAFSVWDEVHNAVARSFIPCDPHEPPSWESEIATALAIKQPKPRQQPGGAAKIRTVSAHQPYLGLLPVWAPSPSLLDADAILSFHRRKAETQPPLLGGAGNRSDKKNTTGVLERRHSSTFSRLLATSVGGGERQRRRSSAVTTRHGASSGEVSSLQRVSLPLGDGPIDSPGTPPSPIPLDDYARYVAPSTAEVMLRLQQQQEGEEANRKAALQRRSTRHGPSRKSRVTTAPPGGDDHKDDNGAREEERGSSPHERSKPRPRRVASPNNASANAEAEALTRMTTPGVATDDEWTKALQKLPRGYLTASANGNGTTARNHAPDAIVLIEGEQAIALDIAKKKRRGGKSTGVNAGALKQAMIQQKRSTPASAEGGLADDGTAMLQVSIANGGCTSFQMMAQSPTVNGIANDDMASQQASPETERRAPARTGVFSIISRKQQRLLEERRRRQKEAAELAAYEHMFVNSPVKAPATNTPVSGATNECADEQQQEHQEEEEQSSNIVPEPGVIVERWPSTPSDKNKRRGSSATKQRGRRGKALQNLNRLADDGTVLADGGEWITPDGKYRWAGFDPAAEEKRAAAAARPAPGLAAPERKPTVPQRATPQKQWDQQRERGNEVENGTESNAASLVAKPPGKTPAKPGMRPPRRALPQVSVDRENGRGGRNGNPQGEEIVAAEAISVKTRVANAGVPRGLKNVPLRITLPRLPQRPMSGDCTMSESNRALTTPSASERNRIRQLASILQSA
ncbi:hypothetical protein DQ04_00241040 [Trypanosoma grayi]|uniref:hypothetical protein n=1 Tax=Trypanosoma grayi TaxID=71804 RepID=UPI0004F4461B|nr:hypothetical protein DQ04_00241040 [Trypanosoma grayi]KEG14962.1 hypothetical protein DQ04_00241040 [Trypanosoma grayi]